MSEVNPVLDEFFPILIENFIRFETLKQSEESRGRYSKFIETVE